MKTKVAFTVTSSKYTQHLFDYRAQVKGHEKEFFCEIKVGTTTWQCTIENLKQGSIYTAQMLSCKKDTTDCTMFFEKQFTTSQDRKYSLLRALIRRLIAINRVFLERNAVDLVGAAHGQNIYITDVKRSNAE